MTTTSAPTRKRGRRTQGPPPTFGIFLYVLGAAILLLGAWGALQGARTWQWPRADAVIIDSDLRRFESEANRGSASVQYDRDYWYSFSVHYRYQVGGTEYVSGGVEPYDFGMQNSAGAQKMKDRHPVGSTARVAYDPDNPRVAYIEPGPSSFSLILIAIGVIIGSCGLWVNRLVMRGVRKAKGEGAAS